MSEIIPFRGIRYNKDKIDDLATVVTQPYDRIDGPLQKAYYERSPYNIVRIIKGKAALRGDVYTAAASFLSDWLDNRILKRDETPSLYVYYQEYTYANERCTRKGFIALGKLEPEQVHAHERTLRGPKEDRLQLMRATEGNFGQIFMLYSDPQRVADRELDAAINEKPPVISVKDDFGNRHEIWQVMDRAVINEVKDAITGKDLYIADGHHRYETAVNFMHECKKRGWKPAAPESFDYRMMTLFNIDEPGITIRPIHRLIHGLPDFDPQLFLAELENAFAVRRCPTLAEMETALKAGQDVHTFGCYTGGIFSTLTVRDEKLIDRLVTIERSMDWKRLDVSVLHIAILERHLGIDAAALEEERNITYSHDVLDAVSRVDQGDEQILFCLNPTSADEVRRVADHGEKMPQKSTDFYPKLLAGLVLSRMEIQK